MVSLIKNNLKIFFKSTYLALSLLMLFIIINAYLILGIHNLSIHKDAFYYLQYSQRISMIFFVFFTFISYEYLIKSKKENLLECFTVINKGNLKLYFSKFIVLTIITMVLALNVYIYNFIVYINMNINFIPYLFHIFLNILLNIFLISFLALCLGSTISLYLKRFPAYSLIILIVILTSPIFESVPYILYMGYGINIYSFRETFNILPPNLGWVGDTLYGLSIEPYRWNLIISWTSFLTSLLLFKLSRKKYKSLNLIAFGLVIIAFYNFYGYSNSGSIVKKDYNPKSYVAYDELYYKKDIQKEELAGFSISAYNMKLTIDRQLQGDIYVYLNEKEPLKSYKFTLYRNYKIHKILSKNNEILKFNREGDYLEVINPTNEKLKEIRISYSGYSPVFYSNSQAVLLPGCFPYYPMEGYKRIYIKEESKFIPIIRDYNTSFNVSIKSNLNIYSNIEKIGDRFSGEAQEITLLGGFLEKRSIENNIYYGLVLDKMDTSLFSNIDKVLKSYKQKLSEDEEFSIDGKTIFQSPVPLSYRVIDNGILNFKDHIFISELSKEHIALGLIQSSLPQDISKRKINTILFNYLINKKSLTNIPKKLLEENPDFEIHNLFFKKVNELGEDYVIKNTYKFLKDKNDRRDSITFIKSLTTRGY